MIKTNNDKSNENKFDLIILLFGIILSQRLVFVGQIYVLEIWSLIYLLFNFSKIKLNTTLKSLLIFLVFHSILVILIDLYNQNDLNSFLKGFFSLPVFFSSCLALFTYFQKDYMKYLSFLIGFYLGDLFINNFFSEFNIFFFENIWKWGAGFLIINLIFILDEFKQKKFNIIFSILIAVIILILSLFNGTRALPLTILYSVILFIIINKHKDLTFFATKRLFIFFSLIVFFSTFLIGFVPQKIDSLKYFKEVNEKNIVQNSGSYGIVLAARSEWISIYHATKDKPIFGHGSYPIDKNYYYSYKIANFLYDLNYINKIPNLEYIRQFKASTQQLIPSHSYLGYHIVSYGLFGSVIMLVLLYHLTKLFLLNAKYLNFYFYFNFITFIYHFYFSPWGASHRILIALFLVALMIKINLLNKKSIKF